ncbi:hypothetical protein V5F53_16945 [Xanthobacter sp. V4C-4]|uniref:hypothetical protein n=1 Tax=Xanthobacter cornucopiae TaxID=3119924 RepID=UPI00372C3B3A
MNRSASWIAPAVARGPGSARRWAGGRAARQASFGISLVLILLALLLIATPPLALLTVPAQHPAAPAPQPLKTFSVSLLA